MIFCWHKWTKWSDPYKTTTRSEGHLLTLNIIEQKRSCSKCNKEELRLLKVLDSGHE